jgi:hypothetical protein
VDLRLMRSFEDATPTASSQRPIAWYSLFSKS